MRRQAWDRSGQIGIESGLRSILRIVPSYLLCISEMNNRYSASLTCHSLFTFSCIVLTHFWPA